MYHIPLVSKNFRGVGYDADTSTMEVVDHTHKVARYSDIPIAVWHAITNSKYESIAQALDRETSLRKPVSIGALEH
jgi:hypothetical protein